MGVVKVLACGYTVDEIAYFWGLVARGQRDECWMWMGPLNRHTGDRAVVVFHMGRNLGNRIAARVAWEMTYGPIPNGLLACHRCDRPWCVNPWHLFLGTHKDNVHDSIEKGRFSKWAQSGFKLNGDRAKPNSNAVKTHCKYGHELSGPNLRVYSGARVCQACARRRTATYFLRKTSALESSQASA